VSLARGAGSTRLPGQPTVSFDGRGSSDPDIVAPISQRIRGRTHVFSRWSDGGLQAHDIVATASPATY
jgi:hypothetical protein